MTSIANRHDPPKMPSFPLVLMKRSKSGNDFVLVDIGKGVVFIEPVPEMLLGEMLLIFHGISWNTLSVRHFGVPNVKEPIDPTRARKENIAIIFPHDHVMCAQLDTFRLVGNAEYAFVYAGHVFKTDD